MNDTPLIAAWRKIAANQDGPPDITVSRPELRRLIAEMDDHRDRVDDEAWNDLFDGVGDEWDGDEAISSIAVRYVQHLRAEVIRLGGCTRPWCREADGEQCDHGYNAAETTVRDGAAMISAERRRQITTEGRPPEHDDTHDGGELADAALCYIVSAEATDADANCVTFRGGYRPGEGVPGLWPWSGGWKPTGDAVRDLVKAGALLAAEIDRRNRRSGGAQ